MPIHKSQISLTKPSKITNKRGIAFEILPSKNSDITNRTFTIRSHQKNFEITSISCEHGCKFDFNDDKLSLTFQCALQHFIIFHIKRTNLLHAVDIVVKSPNQTLFDNNNVYKCEICIPNFDDIKFNLEYKRLVDGSIGVWLTNRWKVKINGSTGNYFFHLYNEKYFADILHLEFDPVVVREQIDQLSKSIRSL